MTTEDTETRALVDALETEVRSLRDEVTVLRGAARVTREPRTYGPGSDASYFQDKALVALNGIGADTAREHLTRYAGELDRIMRDDNPSDRPEAQRARQILFEARRSDDPEMRSGATSSTIAGFTTPAYLIEDYAIYRLPTKSFANQTTKLPITPYGLQVNFPSFTGPATNIQQSAENQGVIIAQSPTGLNIQVNLVLIAGQVPISQQLFDRGGLSGMAFDKIILAQILQNQDAAMDTYVINQATTNAYTTTWSSSATVPNFLSDLSLAREGLSDTAGNRMLATHLFTTSDQFGFWSKQVDSSSNVPFIVPDSSSIIAAEQTGDPKWESWTGVHIAGSLFWHTDDNIPASGVNTQLLVCRPQEIYTFDGENMAFSYEETGAQNLTVQVGMRSYVGAVARFPKSVAAITGTAYPLSNV